MIPVFLSLLLWKSSAYNLFMFFTLLVWVSAVSAVVPMSASVHKSDNVAEKCLGVSQLLLTCVFCLF